MNLKCVSIAGVIFSALFLLSSAMLYRYDTQQKQSADTFLEAAALVQTEPPAANAEDVVVEEPTMTAGEKYAGVYEQNRDFVGWLSIPGTNINYPVMQTADRPNHYLKRGFDGRASDYGVPYIQENCVLGSSDNLVIYGHNMRNGSMFADLCKYQEESFYREHKTISFDTLEGFGTYEIVAVFKTAAYSQAGFKYFNFVEAADEAAFEEFMAKCRELALYDTEADAQYGDRLITLSTCEYSQTNGRMVVVAKLVESHA